jgi:amidase
VTDAAVLLGAATGVDPRDPATADQAGHASTDYTRFLDRHALRGKRIGVSRAGTYDPALVGSVVEPILDQTIAALKAEGATVIDPTDIDLSATANEFPALLCEFKSDIATYLQTYVHGTNPVSHQPYPRTLADLIAFDAAHPDLEGPWNDRSSSLPRRRTAVTRIALPSGRRRRRPFRPQSTSSWPRTTSTRSSP